MEKTKKYKELDERFFMPAFSRDMALVKGKGAKVWDAEGKEYIDCVAGIAVCSTGHCHPAVVKAICEQAHTLIHCSNLYYVPHQGDLAKKLVEITGMHKVFFSNSGAEAIDGALKLARVRTGKKKFVAFTHGFHGRTVGSLAVTHKPEIREPFEPLGLKCSFVDYGDPEGLKKAVDSDTAAILVEPIQGEAGVIIPPEGFMEGIREVCDSSGLPDIVTLAKGIASGFPMGALIAREGLEFKKSEHVSTFAGGPLACAAALATIGVIEKILPDVSRKGEWFRVGLADHNPRVRGLMIGITIGEKCPEVQKRCMEQGVLVNCAADGNLRLVPPLVISDAEIDRAVGVINGALG